MRLPKAWQNLPKAGKSTKLILLALLILAWQFSGLPLPGHNSHASAASSMQTGYYIGTGAAQSISGLGFQPNLVVIKADTSAGSAVWKSSTMSTANTAFLSTATADDTSTMITLNSGGFSVSSSASVGSSGVRYTYTAFAGSNCASTGTFCVGSYTGNGTSGHAISTGFQPDLVWVKRSGASAGTWRSSSMGSNVSQFFGATTQDTAGSEFQSLSTTGFTLGTNAIANSSGSTYWFAAFKKVAGSVSVGSYTGTAATQSITSAGFAPNFVMLKNANATAAQAAAYNVTQSYGDYSSMFTAAANTTGNITALTSNGFNVGATAAANGSGNTIYWAGFGGAASASGSGTFTMADGSYAGTGATQSISGVGFQPDLVIIKDASADYAVFRTSVMPGDSTAYFANGAANFTGGITSLDTGGFTLGTNSTVNTSGTTYHWEAFGNAWDPNSHTGAADFTIGAYTGSGIDGRNITAQPFQPNMVTVKRSGATAGTFRTSATTGDLSDFFASTAEAANDVQALNTDGFQIGTAANVNTAASVYWWFGFKSGANFAVGSYTGTGSASELTSVGFQPDLVWAKRSTAVNGVLRDSSLTGDNTQYFGVAANVSDRITGLSCASGFSLGGSQTETNTNTGTYRYIAWRIPSPGILSADTVDSNGCSVSSPSVSMGNSSADFSCTSTSGTLGVATQKLHVTESAGADQNWNLSIAATSGSTALWSAGSAQMDFNDPSGSPPGCAAGGDSDTYAGLLSMNFSGMAVTPRSGCTSSGIGLASGSNVYFNQDVTDALQIASASGAGTDCYWDFQNIGLDQTIPAGQPPGNYTLGLTVTLVAE